MQSTNNVGAAITSRSGSILRPISTGRDGAPVRRRILATFMNGQRPQVRAWMSAAIVLLVVVAKVASYAIAPYVGPRIYLYVIQPLCWFAPAGVAVCAAGVRRLWQHSAPDIALLATLIAGLQIALSATLAVFVGFGLSPYQHSALAMVGNLWYVAALLVAREVARWSMLQSLEARSEFETVTCVSLVFWAAVVPVAGLQNLANAESAFAFLGGTVLPLGAASLLATYLSLRGGPVAAVGYVGTLAAFEWFSPILPNLTWPVAALVGVLVPVVCLSFIEPSDDAADAAGAADDSIGYSWIAASVLFVVVVWFNAGVFGVQPTLVNGHSMEPKFHTGDLVLTKPVAVESLKVGDIIRFQQGSRDVLHRIIEIRRDDGKLVFETKGDNNAGPDGPVTADRVKGILVAHVGKVGWPGIWFKQALTSVKR